MGLFSSIKEWRPSEISSFMLSSCSVIYCIFLLSLYIVPTATGLITEPDSYEDSGTDSDTVGIWIMIFLFGGSNVFLIYLFLILARPSRSIQGESANGSAFVRVGAVVFGLGSLVYLILCLVDQFTNTTITCSGTVPAQVTTCLGLIFVLLQLAAIILSPRIQIDNHWGGAHFGLMHLLATNLILWMWAVEIESKHILGYAAKNELKYDYCAKPLKGNTDEECVLWNANSKMTETLEPIFYPFLIEFALIGEGFISIRVHLCPLLAMLNLFLLAMLNLLIQGQPCF